MRKMLLYWKNKISAVIAFFILISVLLFLFISPLEKDYFKTILSSLCVNAREVVGLVCLFCLIVLLFFVFTKYGNIRLGGPDAKKEFSNFSWISCLFMAGCGVGIVFYSQEAILHMHNNPYWGKVGGSPESVAYSLTIFNWTLNAWSQFGMLGLIIGYFHFNKHKELKLSSILPVNTNIWIRRFIDIFMALGVIAGLTTSLGLGVIQFKSGLSYVFKTDINPYILILIIGLIATWSVTTGLKRGVKWLSDLSVWLVILLLLILLGLSYGKLHISGFTEYIYSGIYQFTKNFIVYNDVFDDSSDLWAANWAVFYQLWFAAWAAFVAVFVAKISKGRTIREFIIGVVGFPTLFTVLWFGIFGRIGLNYQEVLYPVMQSDITKSLFVFLQQITTSGGYFILSALVMIILCLLFITSSDSGSYVVALMLSETGKISYRDKIFWSSLQCISAMALYACGGLALIQSVSVIMGIIVIVMIFFGSIYFIFTILKK